MCSRNIWWNSVYKTNVKLPGVYVEIYVSVFRIALLFIARLGIVETAFYEI